MLTGNDAKNGMNLYTRTLKAFQLGGTESIGQRQLGPATPQSVTILPESLTTDVLGYNYLKNESFL